VDHVQEIFGYLGYGMPVVIAPARARQDIQMLTSLCRKHDVTRMVVVPSVLRIFLAMHEKNLARELPRLRTWITSGEPLAAEVLKSFLACAAAGSTLINTYGSTEVAGDVSWVSYRGGSELPIGPFSSLGRPMPGAHIHVMDSETLEEVQRGEIGEIVVSGDFVAEGYFNEQAMRHVGFVTLPELGTGRAFRTGDFGCLDSEGLLHYHGRRDQQVKVHGQRVEVLHVEHVLKAALQESLEKHRAASSESPNVAVVAIQSHADAGSCHLHAFLEVGHLDSPVAQGVDDKDLKKLMLQSLLPAFIPVAFWRENALPKLPNSKLDRKALMELACQRVQSDGVEAYSTEIDSFGQMRRIAVQYAEARWAVGNLMVYCLFKVVVGHWTEAWFLAGVVPNIPKWLKYFMAFWGGGEDVSILMGGLGIIHGMGGEERFRLSKLEPVIALVFLFGKYFFGPWIMNHAAAFVFGRSIWDCTISKTMPTCSFCEKAFCPQLGWGPLYFLELLFVGRFLVIGWYSLTSAALQKGTDPFFQGLLILVVLLMSVSLQSRLDEPIFYLDTWHRRVAIYIVMYLFGFYFGPRLVPKRASMAGKRSTLCPVFLLLFIAAGCLPSYFGILPPSSHQCRNDLVSLIFYSPSAVFALLFFLTLPRWLDLRMSPIVLLAIYVVHGFLVNWVYHGVSFHGLQLFPSLPDLIWRAGPAPDDLKTSSMLQAATGLLQLSVLLGHTICFFSLCNCTSVLVTFVRDRSCKPMIDIAYRKPFASKG
jgi:hypothetical protein